MINIRKAIVAPIFFACTLLVMSSCSKDQTVPASEEALVAGEVAERQPSPGTYIITKFIDTGDNETAQFNGYTFTFAANGTLTVNANGQTFTGSWDLNSAETVMTINIAGNAALNDLDDDDWTVLGITNMRIRISAPGPDKVVFNKI